ncbi:MAG: pyridoxamine 5'-phosphate oxidase [Saprospiraceae bacterium]|nr:pyridoxamine 5'-phosphate oxidase [Saprospiraceae bacterium]MCB9320890.1 pyridoxamine 5'-phosphate oxidase [Lewinellaceae bacterium]
MESGNILLREDAVKENPLDQFMTWYGEAFTAEGELIANAMTLATVDEDNKPSARLVMLKGLSAEGFVFYTNFHSRKGHDLARNSQAALVFWWPKLGRQVRVQGQVQTYDATQSTEFFQERPRAFQIGTWASPQSQVVPDLNFLVERHKEVELKYPEGNIPRPPHWGGYLMVPDRMEFWQGNDNHLHDRLEYQRVELGDWQMYRLAP